MITVLVALGLGFALALYTTPLMQRAALQFGIVDHPGGPLKNHEAPVPYLGGLAVFLAFLITLGLTFEFRHAVLGILLSGTLVLLLGLIDDLGALSPLEKLVGQAVAVAVLIKAGVFVKLVFLPDAVALAITLLWLLTITNAFNIIDVMDGLASGVAAIASALLALTALWNGDSMIAVMAAALAGSLLGFLRFNFRPAQIYLGDSGSLFVGLTLGALAMNAGYTERNWVAMLTPVIFLGVPLFDLAFVMLARWRQGKSPFRGSPDHFALRLRRAGLGVATVALWTYAVGIALGVIGLAVMLAGDGITAALIVSGLGAASLVAAVCLYRTGRP